MLKILLNTLQLGIIAAWGIACYYMCNTGDEFQYLVFWIIMGFPFGFTKMRGFLVSKGLGISGGLGIFAVDVIAAGLLGGIFLVIKLFKIIADYIKGFTGLFRRKTA